MNRVKAAFFSLTPPPPADDDGSYLRWHLLDHMPEQYQLPGIVHAARWIADGDYPGHRIAGHGPLTDVGGVVNYLVGEPVQQTHHEFLELGGRLAERGRFPQVRPSLQLTMPALLGWHAAPRALVSAEVVPFRPHRGVVVVVEEPAGGDVDAWLRWLHVEHTPAVLAVTGVAGLWMYGSTDTWRLDPRAQHGRQFVTVFYLDGPPLATARALTPLLEQRWASGAARPLFAGPLRSMLQWDAWPADAHDDEELEHRS